MNNTLKLLIAVVAGLVLATAVFLMSQKSTTYAPSTTVSEVNNSSDLDTVENDLDKENLDYIDSELNQVDSDSSTF